ncbi:MAG: NAD-dependent epimerase/dehydratase family protein [Verrucomicrobia bacterium]|nr:NAD-dependent epimerase/dehydratase family protein [Verrucomicrobiota bacterium]
MNPTRRDFLKLSLAAGAGATFLPNALFAAEAKPKPLKILILGGTGFTGPHQVKYALSRGHSVTVFNRGKTHPGELPKEAEQLIGDRNGKLDALKGRKWDVCIDNPTTLPVWVRDVGEVLKGNVERFVFISTISVYADNSKPGMDETAALAKYTGADVMKETRETLIASKFALYGPLKAASEAEAEKWFPGKTLVIRPGLIVGPGDETDRFTYWPVRVSKGGEVLAPGDKTDPVQIIDARDLAEWTIRAVEQGLVGNYNATGPNRELPIGELLETCKTETKSDAKFVWAKADFLEKQKVTPWGDMPVWVPPIGDSAGFSRVSNRKAVAAGMTFRALPETVRDTLTWFRAQPAERQAKLKAGISPEREKEVLEALKKETAK